MRKISAVLVLAAVYVGWQSLVIAGDGFLLGKVRTTKQVRVRV
jgi:hypothetical protein